MAEVDPGLLRSPEAFLDDLLLWRPPLPVGRIDFSGLFKEDRNPDNLNEAPGYAWERLPRWITEIDKTFMQNPERPIICFDLCSSIPLNAQMLRALEFGRSGRRAREIVRGLFTEDVIAEVEDPDFRALHTAAAQDKTGRSLLESATQAILHTLNSHDMAGGDADLARKRLTDRFYEVLPTQHEAYEMEDGSRNIETRWSLCFTSEEHQVTYFESLTLLRWRTPEARQIGEDLQERFKQVKRDVTVTYRNELEALQSSSEEPAEAKDDAPKEFSRNASRKIGREILARTYALCREDIAGAGEKEFVGDQLAKRYLDWQIDKLVEVISGNKRYRPARFMSLDMSSRALIANSSLMATSEETQSTNLFSHAVASLFDPHQHMPRDMFEPLPVPDDTLTFITCYDAWPLGTSFDNPDNGAGFDWEAAPMTDDEVRLCMYVAVDRLFGFYKKLAPGGKLVIFPWATFDNNERSNSILRRVATQLSLMIGHGVNRTIFHHAALEQIMSESELATTKTLSLAFSDTEDNAVEALIVEKPDSGLVAQHTRDLERRLAIAAQIRD